MSLRYEPAPEPLHISGPQPMTPKPWILSPNPKTLNSHP